jgi:outer membrane protein assembly factor BamB
VRWRYTSHRCGWSSPALAGHLLFATFIGNAECHASRGGGELIAFSPETGHIHWRRAIGPSESSPLVEDGTLYVADQDGYVSAFAAGTGRLRWRFNTGAPIKASPSLAYGRIYIGNYAGEMVALAARTGRLVWRSFGYGNFYSTAAVNAGRVYVGSLDGRVYAFSARNGAVLWTSDGELRLRLAGTAAPSLYDHVALRARRRHRLAALDIPRRAPFRRASDDISLSS